MINQLLTTEYLFWLVAFLFYVLENLKLTKQDELILVETFRCRIRPIISHNGFEISGKEVNILNIFTPYTLYFRVKINSSKRCAEGFLRAARKISLFERRVMPFRVIGGIAFMYLVSGPFLTYYFGISGAFLLLLPMHISCLIGSLIFLFVLRRKLNLSYKDLAAIYMELLLVPAYMAAITKKIANKQSFQCDGFYFALQKSSDTDSTSYEIARKIDLLAANYDEADSRYVRLKNYKSELGLNNVEQ